MIITTTPTIQGREIDSYLGLVNGEAVVGVNIFRDLFANIRDIVGGRAGGYQNALADARREATKDLTEVARALGADAIVGVDVDYESVGQSGGMLMVSINGTAVRQYRLGSDAQGVNGFSVLFIGRQQVQKFLRMKMERETSQK